MSLLHDGFIHRFIFRPVQWIGIFVLLAGGLLMASGVFGTIAGFQVVFGHLNPIVATLVPHSYSHNSQVGSAKYAYVAPDDPTGKRHTFTVELPPGPPPANQSIQYVVGHPEIHLAAHEKPSFFALLMALPYLFGQLCLGAAIVIGWVRLVMPIFNADQRWINFERGPWWWPGPWGSRR